MGLPQASHSIISAVFTLRMSSGFSARRTPSAGSGCPFRSPDGIGVGSPRGVAASPQTQTGLSQWLDDSSNGAHEH